MSDAIEWPPEAREAVARALRRKITGLEVVRWEAWLPETHAALAALAPFVAQIKAAEFQRGAEAMREKAVLAAEETNPAEITNEWEEGWRDAVDDIAAAIRSLPIPEDKP